ncbi:hypothetical protein J5N97_025065 [Dioscorea zingiberensis]|uniref:GED domain-containing protein n=1 Tax=Dioscorea zingiberensis TaxID=325984 RepID=A0A9D5H9N2_9LILI|nr:hypothetical protein J5N97_025065 [Dioscorea zingiberensis]
MTTMESLIGLVNRIQRACTVLGDHGGADGALPTLWEALPSVAVVGGQVPFPVNLKLGEIVGAGERRRKGFPPRGSGIVTRRPLVLQLHKTEAGQPEYAEFLHLPRRKFTDFALCVRKFKMTLDRLTGKSKQISPVPIHLSIYSPNVVNLTLIDLPDLLKVAVEGQPESIVQDIENMVRSYVEKPNSHCIILAISPANQDITHLMQLNLLEKLIRQSEDSITLVDMESSYLTVDFFPKLPQEVEKGANPAAPNVDRYAETHFRRIGSNVSSYIGMVSDTLSNTIPKTVVHCQVREAKRFLLNHFYTQVGRKESKQLAQLLDEDPALMERRQQMC